MKDDEIASRKSDHISINLEQNVNSGLDNGFDRYRFVHNALPEIALAKVNTCQELFGRSVHLPFLISSMTGGTEKAAEINKRLARVAEKFGLAMGVGSQRAAIDFPHLATSFQIREFAPNILMFANLGAVQFNYGYGIDECKRAVEMIGADGLILHLNPLQEAIQPNGDTNFSGLLKKIEKIARELIQPIVVKEVGWGISGNIAKKLVEAGVAAIDVSGAGGTSWSQVERFRLSAENDIQVAESFVDWGLPTAQVLCEVVNLKLSAKIIASGGLKTGIDFAKALAMGADLVGMAGAILKKAVISEEVLSEQIGVMERVLRIAMFSTGSSSLWDFQKNKLAKVDN